MLLDDVFKELRNVCSESYKLDPRHYFSSSELIWEAMFKMTRTIT